MLTFASYRLPLDDRAASIDSQLEHGLQRGNGKHLLRSTEIGIEAPLKPSARRRKVRLTEGIGNASRTLAVGSSLDEFLKAVHFHKISMGGRCARKARRTISEAAQFSQWLVEHHETNALKSRRDTPRRSLHN